MEVDDNSTSTKILAMNEAYIALYNQLVHHADGAIKDVKHDVLAQLKCKIEEYGGTVLHHHPGHIGGLPVIDLPPEPVIDPDFVPRLNPCVERSWRASASLVSQENHWWQSWGKHFQFIAERMFFPRSVDELAIAISRAEQDGVPVKPLGGGWSFSDAVLPGTTFSTRPFALGLEPFAQLIPAVADYSDHNAVPLTAGVLRPGTFRPADSPGSLVLKMPDGETETRWTYAGGGTWTVSSPWAISDAAPDELKIALAPLIEIGIDITGILNANQAYILSLERGYYPAIASGEDAPGTLVSLRRRGEADSQRYYAGRGKWILRPQSDDPELVGSDRVITPTEIVVPSLPEFSLSMLERPRRAYLINTQNMVSSLQQHFPLIASDSLGSDDPDSERHFIHVEAGITMADLSKLLSYQSPRLAIEASGGSPGATLAGALATATHGGEHRKPLLVDRVKAVHLVGPGGVQWWIEGDTPIADPNKLMARYPCLTREHIVLGTDEVEGLSGQDWLNAVVVSMGTMGVVYSMVLEVVPLFGIREVVVERRWQRLLRDGSDPEMLRDITVNDLRLPPRDPEAREQIGETILAILDGLATNVDPGRNQYIDIAIDPNPYRGTVPGSRDWNCWVVNREFLEHVPLEQKPLAPAGFGGIFENISRRLESDPVANRLMDIFNLDAIRRFQDQALPVDAVVRGYHQLQEKLPVLDRIMNSSDLINAVLDELTGPFESVGDFAAASAIVSGVFSGLFGVTDGRSESIGVASEVGAIGFPGSGVMGTALEVGMRPADAFPFIQNEILDRLSEPFFGYISVRICPQTNQFLGMQQYAPSVMIELVGFATQSARDFVDKVQGRVIEMINEEGLDATLHWGLECDQMTGETLRRIPAYNTGSPTNLEKFQSVRNRIRSVIPDVSVHDNNFSQRLGL